jgi:3D (Asp-Asp-Asp) domain-containing protein
MRLAFAAVLLAAGPGLGGCGDDDDPKTADAGTDAGPDEPGPVIGTFALTYYWVADEAELSGTDDTELYTSACTVLASVPAAFADSVAIEGTGRLDDGRMINVDGPCGCAFSPCFLLLGPAYPWGMGTRERPLVPFRSIAVDPGVLEIGASYYLEELRAKIMPGESPWGMFRHDGCVAADDVGGGIVGEHVDFFAARRRDYESLDADLGLTTITVRGGGTRCP